MNYIGVAPEVTFDIHINSLDLFIIALYVRCLVTVFSLSGGPCR